MNFIQDSKTDLIPLMPFSWKGFVDSLEREMTKPTLDSHHPSGIRSPLRYHRILENFQPYPTSNIPESPPFLWNEDTVEINWNEYIYNTQRCDVSFHRKKKAATFQEVDINPNMWGLAALLTTPLNTTPLQIKMAEIRKGVLLWTLATTSMYWNPFKEFNVKIIQILIWAHILKKKWVGKKNKSPWRRLNLDGQQSTTFECLVISSECTFENNNSCQIFVWFPNSVFLWLVISSKPSEVLVEC